jgi:phosphatidylglycerophosphate synthase
MHTARYMTLPNGLTLARIVFLPLLFALANREREVAFVVAYALVGATDFFDGIAARKLNQASSLGQTLDSVVDIPFYLSTCYFLYRLHPEYLYPNMTMLWVFLALFAASFVVSGFLCRKPILMHTSLLRLQAILVYLLVILSAFFDTTLFVTLILVIYYVAFAEEILIFIRHGEVDPDSPSIFDVRPKR